LLKSVQGEGDQDTIFQNILQSLQVTA